MRDADDMANESAGLREDDYRERQAEIRRRQGPEWEAADLPICESCEAGEATMERADGKLVCADCYADAADYAFDRMLERARGDRP